jgi:hypothetical protein
MEEIKPKTNKSETNKLSEQLKWSSKHDER